MVEKNIFLTCVNSESYIVGVVSLAVSLHKKTGKRLKVMLTKDLHAKYNDFFNRNYIDCIVIENDYSNKEIAKTFENNRMKYWLNTLYKLNIFRLIEYDKICFLDSDMYVLKDISYVFDYDNLTAVQDSQIMMNKDDSGGLNSGFFIIEPKIETFNLLLSNIEATHKEKGIFGDQDVINYCFPDWGNNSCLHASLELNSCAYFLDRYKVKSFKVLHYFGSTKPWNWTFKYYLIRQISYLIRFRFLTFTYLRKYYWLCRKIKNELLKSV